MRPSPEAQYYFRIDDAQEVPDPASRFQPRDVHGPSEVIDPETFDWQDAAGVAADGKKLSSMSCMSERSRRPELLPLCASGSTISPILELPRWS